MSVDAAVRQYQFQRVSKKTDSVLAGSGIALLLYKDVFPFADREKSFDGFDLRNGSQDRGGSNEVANLDLCNPGDSIHQRGDFRPLKVEFCLFHSGLVRFDAGLAAKLCLNLVI